MTEEHDYNGLSHEVVVASDPLSDMRRSIVNLTEMVTKLAERVQSAQEEPLGHSKRTQSFSSHGEDEVSLHGDTSSLIDSAGSPRGHSIEDEPPAKKAKRTSFTAEKSNTTHNSKRTSSQTAEDKDTDGKSSSDINALFTKTKAASIEGKKTASLEVEEEILCAVEAERPPGANVPAGDPVLQNLADRVVKYWQADLKKSETHKVLQDKYKTPSNCSSITAPLINEVIYYNLSGYTKRIDHEMVEIQKDIITAANSMIQISQSVLEADKKSTMVDSKEIVKKCFDAITMLGTAHAKLNNKRKHAISSSLDPEIKDVCSSRHTVTGYLFGDDLPKAIKDAKEVSKLTKSVGSQNQHQKGRRKQQYGPQGGSYNYNNNNNNSRNSSSKTSFFQKAKKPYFKQKRPSNYKS